MKYAREVINLLAAYPGRNFAMRQIINSIRPGSNRLERLAIQRGAHRVLKILASTGKIDYLPPNKNGAQGKYAWKT